MYESEHYYLHDGLARGRLRALVQPQFLLLGAGAALAEQVAAAVVVQRRLGPLAERVHAEGPPLRRAEHERLVGAAGAARVQLVAHLEEWGRGQDYQYGLSHSFFTFSQYIADMLVVYVLFCSLPVVFWAFLLGFLATFRPIFIPKKVTAFF